MLCMYSASKANNICCLRNAKCEMLDARIDVVEKVQS